MARPKKETARIYARDRGGLARFYGDFRLWKDVGGGLEPLKSNSSELATTDRGEAERLYHLRADELDKKRKRAEVLGEELGIKNTAALHDFAAHHLEEKAKSGAVTEHCLQVSEQQLTVACDFFGRDRELHTIRVPDVRKFANWLATQPVRRGRPRKEGEPPKPTLSRGSQRKYLNTLSNLFVRAQEEEVVPLGHNPVAAMMEKPVASKREAKWLEIHEAALLLEAARTFTSSRPELALPCVYPLIATMLLTGGRESEVLGLELDDVSFDRKTITFRLNKWRRLKTGTSHRPVPLWPQLEEILREYLFGSGTPKVDGLLFPATRPAIDPVSGRRGQAMITDWRKVLDAVAARAGWAKGEIRTKMFRHGYCATRLQTLDNGAPVSNYTVGQELGHGGDSMVRRVYGHLGAVRHRSDVVEFRIEQHRERLADRLSLVGSDRTS